MKKFKVSTMGTVEAACVSEVSNKMFEVWHVSTPHALMQASTQLVACWRNNRSTLYLKVAEVHAHDVEEVWDITQNVQDSWTQAPEVTWCSSHELRSTSVGDMIVHRGSAWLVAPVGWIEIPKC